MKTRNHLLHLCDATKTLHGANVCMTSFTNREIKVPSARFGTSKGRAQKQQAAKTVETKQPTTKATNRRSGRESHTNSKKNSTQQEKPASNSNKKWHKQLKTTKAAQTLWKGRSGKSLFFQTTRRKIEAKKMWVRKVNVNPWISFGCVQSSSFSGEVLWGGRGGKSIVNCSRNFAGAAYDSP